MSLTNKQMDEALERVAELDAFSLAHCSDNSPGYIAHRYGHLYGDGGFLVPVRAGVILPGSAKLFPAHRLSEKKGKYEWTSASPLPGIRAVLRDAYTGELAEYQIETDHRNGVEIVAKLT